MHRIVSLAIAVALALAAAPSARQRPSNAPRVRIAYFFSDGNISGTLKAYKALLRERPDLRDRVSISFLTESMLADVNVKGTTTEKMGFTGREEGIAASAVCLIEAGHS